MYKNRLADECAYQPFVIRAMKRGNLSKNRDQKPIPFYLKG